MTDEQFKELIEKLDQIERQIASGEWRPLFRPPLLPQPGRPWDGLPPTWELPRVID